uniref:Cysteine-rich protein 1 n=1 Tax=Vannella robusta TaxID=1487602 RepID=A0A6U1XUR0_9EUKA
MPLGGAPKCPKCGKTVYFAEKQNILKQDWHKACVKCETCNKKLEPGNFSDREGKIYCKTCYNLAAGVAGYGYGNTQSSFQSYGKAESTLDKGDGNIGGGVSAYCNSCGEVKPTGAKFCSGCGKSA